jgi:hypothetical protein
MLLQGGRLAASIPFYARPLFLAVSDALLEHALDAKNKGDQSAWESRLIRWFSALSSLLKRTGGGVRGRGQRRLITRLTKMAEKLRSDVNQDLTSEEKKELSEEEALAQERKADSEREKAIQRSIYLLRQGFGARASKAMMNKGKVVFNDDVALQLKQLIPQTVPEAEKIMPDLPADAIMQTVIANSSLRRFINQFASKGAAPGPLQISGRVLSVVVSSAIGLNAVAAILTDLTNGTFSDVMRPWFLSSVGVALPKPNGGIRPICIGDVFYRLAATR